MSKNVTSELQDYIDMSIILGEEAVLVANLNALDTNRNGVLTYREIQNEGEKLFSERNRFPYNSEAYLRFDGEHSYGLGFYAKQYVTTQELRENYQALGLVERTAAGLLVNAGVTNDAIRDINRTLGQLDGLNVRLDEDYAKDAFNAVRSKDGQGR